MFEYFVNKKRFMQINSINFRFRQLSPLFDDRIKCNEVVFPRPKRINGTERGIFMYDIFNEKLKIAILGGDKRQVVISNCFIRCGCEVRAFALSDVAQIVGRAEICMTAEKAMENADIVILPLPVTRDNLHLNAQCGKVLLTDIVRLAEKNSSYLFGGMIPLEMIDICEKLGVEITDYYKSEGLQRKNALPSAEGALMIAMEHTDITVRGMRALVTGYGRIGTCLSQILQRLGADVTVAARRDESLCEASLMGYKVLRLDSDGGKLGGSLNDFDVIFNTVPYIIFSEKVLKECQSKPLYIEIASSPGGIDIPTARKIGIETVFAPSMPGKYAPVSAGEYVFETISDTILKRRKQ